MNKIKANPFLYSDTNKRYHTYDYYLRRRYGRKGIKISLDAGFTCPNIDGTKGFGGCAFCSGRFGTPSGIPIRRQYDYGRAVLAKKWGTDAAYIPYLQANTNTYAPVGVLRDIYEQVLVLPDISGVNIATRADTLPDDVVELLTEIAGRTFLTVELGLQTIHDETAQEMNRGHNYAEFLSGYNKLKKAGIETCVHIIDGLPGENREMMLDTAREIARIKPAGIKIHLLYVLRGTLLADEYGLGRFNVLTLDEYADTVCSQLELLPSDIYIGRVTGDGEAASLIAPLWSLKKLTVMNEIDKEFVRRDSYQGILYDMYK